MGRGEAVQHLSGAAGEAPAPDDTPAAWPSLAELLADPSRVTELPRWSPPSDADTPAPESPPAWESSGRFRSREEWEAWFEAQQMDAEFAERFGKAAERFLHAFSDAPRPAPRKPKRKPIPPAPELSTLPRITKGAHKGERWMTKRQFAGWCGVAVATVSEWVHTGQIDVWKQGCKRQSRALIASGERERRAPPVIGRRQRERGRLDDE